MAAKKTFTKGQKKYFGIQFREAASNPRFYYESLMSFSIWILKDDEHIARFILRREG